MPHTDIVLTARDYGIVIAFIVLITTVGLYFSKRAGRSTGGRSLPWYLAGTSMVATTFAADTPLTVTNLLFW